MAIECSDKKNNPSHRGPASEDGGRKIIIIGIIDKTVLWEVYNRRLIVFENDETKDSVRFAWQGERKQRMDPYPIEQSNSKEELAEEQEQHKLIAFPSLQFILGQFS